jgi:hypothetical protein
MLHQISVKFQFGLPATFNVGLPARRLKRATAAVDMPRSMPGTPYWRLALSRLHA